MKTQSFKQKNCYKTFFLGIYLEKGLNAFKTTCYEGWCKCMETDVYLVNKIKVKFPGKDSSQFLLGNSSVPTDILSDPGVVFAFFTVTCNHFSLTRFGE